MEMDEKEIFKKHEVIRFLFVKLLILNIFRLSDYFCESKTLLLIVFRNNLITWVRVMES